MAAIFGTMEVHIVTIEWDDLDDIDVDVADTLAGAQILARQRVIETMKLTVDEYSPDGCREFILTESELTAEAWLAELHELTTVPWVTITTRTIEIR